MHWLPVRRQVDLKLATFMFKTLHDVAPPLMPPVSPITVIGHSCVCCAVNQDSFGGQIVRCCRSSGVESRLYFIHQTQHPIEV